MHLINEIGIRKTYADSCYRDRGPLSVTEAHNLSIMLWQQVNAFLTIDRPFLQHRKEVSPESLALKINE